MPTCGLNVLVTSYAKETNTKKTTWNYTLPFFIEVSLTCNARLVSGVQCNDPLFAYYSLSYRLIRVTSPASSPPYYVTIELTAVTSFPVCSLSYFSVFTRVCNLLLGLGHTSH